jgi:AcrR family transcriptional regulator
MSKSSDGAARRTPTRPWRGIDAAARTAERRRRLVDAGLECFARSGYAETTVFAICREAGLTQRYFYESFGNREALLIAVIEALADELRRCVFAVLGHSGGPLEMARLAIGAAVHALVEDPRRAQVLLVESVGVSPNVEHVRRRYLGELTELVREVGLAALQSEGRPLPSRLDAELTARALVGASIELLVAHVRGELDVPPIRLAEHLARLYGVAAPLASEPPTQKGTS